MNIFRLIYCLFAGHSFIDITRTVKPYCYCLRCGKIQEPMDYLKAVHVQVNAKKEDSGF